MIALGNLLQAVSGVLHMLIFVFYWILIARVILSFVSPDPRNMIVQFIYGATEPVLSKLRNGFLRLTGKQPVIGMLDFTPILVLAVIYFLDAFVVQSLAEYGMQFKHDVVAPITL